MADDHLNEAQGSIDALAVLRSAVRATRIVLGGETHSTPAARVSESPPPSRVAEHARQSAETTADPDGSPGAGESRNASPPPAAQGAPRQRTTPAAPPQAAPPRAAPQSTPDRPTSRRSADQPALFDALPAIPPHVGGRDGPRRPSSAGRFSPQSESGPNGGVRAAKPEPPRANIDLAAGHRDRLRARFDRGEALPDYELLELLLFRSIPRRDTKPIAKALIAEFGSFAAVLCAPSARLMEISGVAERVIGDFRLIRAAAERLTHDTLAERSVLGSTDAVVDFYRAKLRGIDREEFHVLYLDKKNKMLATECAGVGTVDHTPVYPREVLTRALELRASAVVLIHNHPSGDPTPSRADIAVTARIIEGAASLSLSVHDHIIIGANTYTSLRGEGYV